MFIIYCDDQLIYSPLLTKDQTVISPKLNVEIGKSGSLFFGIVPTHNHYGKINKLKSIIKVERDSKEIFRGRAISVDEPFSRIRQFYCEGDLSFLVDSVQKVDVFNGRVHDMFKKIIINHNKIVDELKQFEVGIINVENRPLLIYDTNSEGEQPLPDPKKIIMSSSENEYGNSLDVLKNLIIDHVGGNLRTRRVGNKTYLDLLEDFPQDNSENKQSIQLGVNLLDLNKKESVEDIFTVLIPLGDDQLNIKEVNSGKEEIIDQKRVLKYGRIVRSHTFENVNDASTLLENARMYLSREGKPKNTIEIRAIDLNLIDDKKREFSVGEKIHIISSAHDLDGEELCTKIEYDLENPANTRYIFGTLEQELTYMYKENNRIQENQNTSTKRHGRKKAKQAVDEFNKSWINWDPNIAHVSLGALYKKILKDQSTLLTQVGIDLDGKLGNINLKSLQTKTDAQEKVIESMSGRIDVNYNNISLQVAKSNELVGKYAELKLTVDGIKLNINDTITGKFSKIDQELERITMEIGAEHEPGNYSSIWSRVIQTEREINTYFYDKDKNIFSTIKKNATGVEFLSGEIGKQQQTIANLTNDGTLFVKRLEAAEFSIQNFEANYIKAENIQTERISIKQSLFSKKDIHAMGTMYMYGGTSVPQKVATEAHIISQNFAKLGTYASLDLWVNSKNFAKLGNYKDLSEWAKFKNFAVLPRDYGTLPSYLDNWRVDKGIINKLGLDNVLKNYATKSYTDRYVPLSRLKSYNNNLGFLDCDTLENNSAKVRNNLDILISSLGYKKEFSKHRHGVYLGTKMILGEKVPSQNGYIETSEN